MTTVSSCIVAIALLLAGVAHGACLVNGVPVSDALETAPDSRYQINPDGTVIDLRTRLMWKQCKQGFSGAMCDVGVNEGFTFAEALAAAAAENFAGHADWRVPSITELLSIAERCSALPAVNLLAFPNIDTRIGNAVAAGFLRSSTVRLPLSDTGAVDEAWTFNTLGGTSSPSVQRTNGAIELLLVRFADSVASPN